MIAPASPGDTTVATITRGAASSGGWRSLLVAPGEARRDPVPIGDVIGCVWHLSDLHVCDCESPARLEYLDRYSDPDSPYREVLGDIGTYRPQELLTVQVATTMVASVNSILLGPTTGAPIDKVVITGDLTDNAQLNELQWYQRILDGGVISPRSGADVRSAWVGSSDSAVWDERYWHPDGAPQGRNQDRPTRLFGYPAIPGLTDASRHDVQSPGLAIPWVSVFGNHDGLLQGTVPASDSLRRLAVGSDRIIGLPAGASPLHTALAVSPVGPADYVHDTTSPRIGIPPDHRRALATSDDFARVTRSALGPNYFATDVGSLRLIALDTINPHGGWQGSIDDVQLSWLRNELAAAHDRYVLIASHHPSPTLVNEYTPTGVRRVLGPEVVDVLLAHPCVIAWIAGHVHFHAAGWHAGESGGGFWEITTASLIDWPQQGRVLEVIRATDRGVPEVAIISTVVDHGAPAIWSATALHETANLAAISRSLSANDYRIRDGSLRGLNLDSTPAVRNVVWRLADPFG